MSLAPFLSHTHTHMQTHNLYMYEMLFFPYISQVEYTKICHLKLACLSFIKTVQCHFATFFSLCPQTPILIMNF